ncbi:MAG: hypothetical protein ACREFB_20410 [Stellaceae bacterium]
MQAQHAAPSGEGQSFCAWFGLWVPLFVLAVLALLGAFVAGGGAAPGDYACGLVLSICSLLLAFMRIKHHFDAAEGETRGFLLVDTVPNLAIVIPLFVVIGLGGVYVAAAWDAGSLHNAGVALFGACGFAVFLSLKSVYDALDRHR